MRIRSFGRAQELSTRTGRKVVKKKVKGKKVVMFKKYGLATVCSFISIFFIAIPSLAQEEEAVASVFELGEAVRCREETFWQD